MRAMTTVYRSIVVTPITESLHGLNNICDNFYTPVAWNSTASTKTIRDFVQTFLSNYPNVPRLKSPPGNGKIALIHSKNKGSTGNQVVDDVNHLVSC